MSTSMQPRRLFRRLRRARFEGGVTGWSYSGLTLLVLVLGALLPIIGYISFRTLGSMWPVWTGLGLWISAYVATVVLATKDASKDAAEEERWRGSRF